MGFSRSFSFPLSHAEQLAAKASPFSLDLDEEAKLRSSEGFQVVRNYLANERSYPFCQLHNPDNPEDEEAWLLHRDITHALILPILQIFRRASALAVTLLGTRTTADLEIAFRGDARGAFSWLQCFVAEEEDWCITKGCPACIVHYVLQSEPTVRLVLVAARLSQHLGQVSHPNSPCLPTFTFWLGSLRTALTNDPFWGPDHFDDIEPRARYLEDGIQDLIAQCCTLESILQTNPETKGNSSSLISKTNEVVMTQDSGGGALDAKDHYWVLDNAVGRRFSSMAERGVLETRASWDD
ncbi:MAG: hypothetical protein M1835_006987 [Candelina submexicana]|nr:MAG: hypothetical protein M1835_006987 [Candelina submexicana]